ncbi:MAG: TolC family protein [Myxococcales bacterium]|nr:TolC family protein [Myxococcales bacterium]
MLRSSRPRRVSALVLAVTLATCCGAARAAEPLRLEDAVRLALQNNERARRAPLRIDVAEGQKDRARGAFLPTLQAAGAATLRSEEDRNGRILTTAGTATLTQPILSAGSFPLYSQAGHQLEAERYGAKQDKRLLALDAARAFLQALTSERVLEAASRRLERARANLDNAEARASAQLASVNDATRARLELTSSQREVTSAQATVARAYVQLGFLVGRAVAPPLSPPDRTTKAAESFEAAPANQVKTALGRRADVLASRERTLALEKAAQEPMLRLVPAVTAQGQVRVLPEPLPTERAHEETATLNLVWNIFDAGQRYADRKTRVAQAQSQALDDTLLRRSVETDVALALVTLRTSRELYRVAEEAVVAAQKNSEETEILYRQGLARALELTDANGKRFDAEVARASAKLSMEQAYLELRFALGFDPVDGGGGDDGDEGRPGG